ncbi:proline rich membrane-anchored mycosin MycP5 domain protein [Mycobacterium xenopi 3993]|nr:proline rich membrane-anchored mycosin MycP5 domain protein [Mycobacterium xenopi 3993]
MTVALIDTGVTPIRGWRTCARAGTTSLKATKGCMTATGTAHWSPGSSPRP